jgi:pimeloyl-ACP methyl ester carboxylesterase
MRSGSSAMISAAMAPARRRPAHTRLSASAAMCWPSPIIWGSSGSRFAACRWAGSPGNGSASTPARGSTAWFLPARRRICRRANLGSAHRHGREKGLAGIVDVAIERFFSEDFRRSAATTVAGFRRTLLATSAEGYIACCQAVRDADFRQEIKAISVPTLVISGTRDPATPPDRGAAIADAIQGARFVVLDGAHIINVEQPAAFNRELLGFLGQVRPAGRPALPGRHGTPPGGSRRTLGSTAPLPGATRSMPSSRTSSPAMPGARSGPGPGLRRRRAGSSCLPLLPHLVAGRSSTCMAKLLLRPVCRLTASRSFCCRPPSMPAFRRPIPPFSA